MSNDIVSQAIVQLFESEMFYAEIITQMRRILNPKLPAVAGVCIKNQLELHINPVMFEELSPKERIGVLRHECEHILRDHIPRMKELNPSLYDKKENKDDIDSIIDNMKHKIMNIAADCAINGNIANIPEWAMFPANFNLPAGMTFEWYMNALKSNEKMKEMTQFDDHSLWKESTDQDHNILREKIRQAINKAANKTRAAGKMTSDNELLVSDINKNTISWKDQLKRFVANSIECKVETSKKKRNRRYGVMYPGNVKIEDLHIGVAIDTSGSVSDAALSQFIAEIANIAKYAKVTVVEADSEIKNSYVFKPKKEYKISGRGGTAYKPAFEFFNNVKDIDGVIYFGDMDCTDEGELNKPKYPVLWAIVGDKNFPATFGSSIKIVVV